MDHRLSSLQTKFQLEEATIDELHAAIRCGETTCLAVVQHYLARVRAFNGVSSILVTEDGRQVPEAKGAIRALRSEKKLVGVRFMSRSSAVCAENLVRIDRGRESPQLSGP